VNHPRERERERRGWRKVLPFVYYACKLSGDPLPTSIKLTEECDFVNTGGSSLLTKESRERGKVVFLLSPATGVIRDRVFLHKNKNKKPLGGFDLSAVDFYTESHESFFFLLEKVEMGKSI